MLAGSRLVGLDCWGLVAGGDAAMIGVEGLRGGRARTPVAPSLICSFKFISMPPMNNE